MSITDMTNPFTNLYEGIPPGNLGITMEIDAQSNQDFLSYISFNNTNLIFSLSNPKYFYKINNNSKNAVIIIPGGGASQLTIDVEGLHVVDYWYDRGFSVFVYCYRLPYLTNSVSTIIHDDIYNLNAYPFLPVYDLNQLIKLIKNKYQLKKIFLQGFSAGGFIATSYSSITSFNYEIMEEIEKIVEDPEEHFPSSSLLSFIRRYQEGGFSQKPLKNIVNALILNYSKIDGTIPNITKPSNSPFYSSLSFLSSKSTYSQDIINSLTLLFSNKLYSDGYTIPYTYQGKMSLITDSFPPTFLLSCQDDPFVSNVEAYILTQNLLKNNVLFTRQYYLFGGHGFGMGNCYADNTIYPKTNFPFQYYNRKNDVQYLEWGSDQIYGSYQQYNQDKWNNPPWIDSNLDCTLNEFIIYFSIL